MKFVAIVCITLAASAAYANGYPPQGCPGGMVWNGKECKLMSYPPTGCPNGTSWNGQACVLKK